MVVVTVTAGLILGVYWLRQGGDFMHGRVLLSPVFILLLPVMVIPVTIPTSLATKRSRAQLGAGLLLLGGVITTVVGRRGQSDRTAQRWNGHRPRRHRR